MDDVKVEMQNAVEIDEVECLTPELKSESMDKEFKSPQPKGGRTELNSGVKELSAELTSQKGDENLLRTLINKEQLNTQNALEEPSKELNSPKVVEGPVRTLMKLNWENCDVTTGNEILQEVRRYMGEKEVTTDPLEVNSSKTVNEPLKTLMKLDWKHCDANTISEILKRIQNILKNKRVKEEPPELNTQRIQDNVPSSVQKHPVSDLRNVSIEKEVELCSDKEDSNTVVQTSEVVRSGKLENELVKGDKKALTAHLRNIRKQTPKSSVCEINGTDSVVIVESNKIVISEEIKNQERKGDALPQPTCPKSNADGTLESPVCNIKVREPDRVLCNNVVISKKIENQEKREDVVLLSTPLPAVEKKVPSSIFPKPLERDFPKHAPIISGDFLCDICLACFNNKGSLTKHRQVHSKDLKDDDDDDPDVQVDKVVISHQGKTEGEVQLFPKTIKTVSKVFALECPVCLKNFRRKYDLRRHLLIHSGTNFQCVLCSTCYKNKEELSEHMRTHPLDVEVQSPKIQTDNVLRTDKNEVEASLLPQPTKTDSESTTFECPFCKKTIRRRFDFRKHLSRHSGLDFQCVLCQTYCESKEDVLEHLRKHSVDHLIKKTNIQSNEVSDKCESKNIENMLELKAIGTNVAVESLKHREGFIDHMPKLQKAIQDGYPNVQSDNVVMSDKTVNEKFQTIFQTKTEVQIYDQKRNIKEYSQVKYVGSNPIAHCDKIISDKQKTEKEEIMPMKINSGIKTDENKLKRKTPENSLVSNVVHSYKVAKFENIETLPSKQIVLNIGESIQKYKETVSECKQKSANLTVHPDSQSDNVFEFDKYKQEEENSASLPKSTREFEVNLTKIMQTYSKENQPANSAEETVTDNQNDRSSMSQLSTNGIKKTEQTLKRFMKKSKSRVQSNGKVECDVCLTRFKHKSSLVLHRRKHYTGNPYLCKICKKSFSEDRQLVIHFRTHSRAKAFQCDLCEKRFSQYSYLRVHMRVHSGEKSYVCGTWWT